MKIFNKFIWSKKEPSNKNDVWFDGSTWKMYTEEAWQSFTLSVDAADTLTKMLENASEVYQEKLNAGYGIVIEGNTISVDESILYDDSDVWEAIETLQQNKVEQIQLNDYVPLDRYASTSQVLMDNISELNSTKADKAKTEQELNKKLNKTDVATINGQSLIKGGNIVIPTGGESYDDTEIKQQITELSAEIGTKEKALFANAELNDLVKEVYTSTEGFDYKAVALVKVRIAYFASSKYYNAIYFHASDNSVILVAQNTYATEAEALAAWNEGIFISSDSKTYALVSPVAASVVKDFSGESLSHPLTEDFSPSISASLALNLANTIEPKIEECKTILKICAKETYGVNLFDKRRAKLGIIDGTNIASSAKYYYSHPIYCEVGKYKQTPAPGDLSDRPSYAVCDENGVPIKGYYATNEDGFYIYTINEPCYIIVNIGRSAALDAAMFCKYDQYPSVYTPYTATLKYSNIPISNIIGVSELNPLTNKKMLICGDSIAYGGGRGYGILIGEKNSMQVTTHAIDGAIITIGGESTKSRIYQQLLNGADGMDYVILEGGVNDMTNDNLGEIEQSFTAQFNEETFCGSFEKIISTMIAKYPTAKMGYVAVHRIKQWKDDNYTTWQDTGYYTKAVQICRKWGIPVCDLTHETPSLFEIKALKEAYTRNQDGWHPNEEGYRLFYCDKIEAWMKTL